MKLVTFDDGLTGRIADENVVEVDVPSMREYFERDGHGGEVRGKKFFHTFRPVLRPQR